MHPDTMESCIKQHDGAPTLTLCTCCRPASLDLPSMAYIFLT